MKAVGILVTTAAVLLLVVGLFSYLMTPNLIERWLATNLRQEYGLAREPEVEVSSSFPPELLLGRVDRIEVHIDRMVQEGILLRDVRMDLRSVDISLPSLLRGSLQGESRAAFLRAEVPEASINQYLQRHGLGSGSGEIEIHPDEVVYRHVDPLSGTPASASLDVRVGTPQTLEVVPERVSVAGVTLPFSLRGLFSYGGWKLNLGELPFGTKVQSVDLSQDTLIVRASK